MGFADEERGLTMPGEENEAKTLMDLVITGGIGAALAALFQAVRAARDRTGNFDMKNFIAGLAGAAAVGAVAAWTLDAFGIGKELSAVIISMCGYTGGKLLDIVEAEVPETIQSAFDGLQDKLKKGEWPKNDE